MPQINHIGIDPGISGAIAIIQDSRIIDIIDYTDDIFELNKVYKSFSKKHTSVIIEECLFFGNQSFKNQFKYIETYFVHKLLMKLHGIPFVEVKPSKWKKEFKLGKDKKESFQLAKQWFDDADKYLKVMSKHHNRAEALLLAEYLRRSEGGINE